MVSTPVPYFSLIKFIGIKQKRTAPLFASSTISLPPLPTAFDFVPHLCFTNFQSRKIQIPNKSQNITQNLKKPLTNHFLCDRILKRKRAHQYLAELCSGSTADSDSVCLGSNPSSAAKRRKTPLRSMSLS